MNEINRESFEAWLFSQPPEREFNYSDIKGGCAVCTFVRETTSYSEACGGSDYYGVRLKNNWADVNPEIVPLPDWLKSGSGGVLNVLERRPGPLFVLTIQNMQRRYLELFPTTHHEPTQSAPHSPHRQAASPAPSAPGGGARKRNGVKAVRKTKPTKLAKTAPPIFTIKEESHFSGATTATINKKAKSNEHQSI